MTSKLQRSPASRAPRIFLGFLLATTALAAHPDAFAQNTGYLSGHEVDFRTVLGPPPAVDSPLDRADQAAVMAYQDVDDARRQEAKLDERQLYSRFAEAFGRPIDERSSPTVVTILDRALRDVDFTASRAKDHFSRPRPFQRLRLRHVCDKDDAPEPEEHPMHGASYPSGHSTHGWAVAEILARVAPERAEALMKRAQDYEQSRLVCGMHFPTDVEAGHIVATAVVAHLDASKEFHADLIRARREYSGKSR
jgi:acid phosphatase (class A)